MTSALEPIAVHPATFVLKIPDIDTVGYYSHCSGLALHVDVLEYREGGNNDVVHRLPGTLSYPNLILSRGLTNTNVLIEWLLTTTTQAERKEITLTLGSGSRQRVWTFADAFPVDWKGPEISISETHFATETLEIAHAGLKVG